MGCGQSQEPRDAPQAAGKKKGENSPFHQKYQFTGVELGRGGFSVVKEAIEKKERFKVAVKIITKKDHADPNTVLNEVKIMQRLKHPHIMKLYDFYDESETWMLVLELATGRDLFDRVLSKKHYTEYDARELFTHLVKVVEYMHSVNVVHRDLKPENVLLFNAKSDSDIKLCDFGFSTICEDGATLTDRLGTPNYVAPEIILKHPYGKQVDVWALGIILFILLSGAYPFQEDDIKHMFKKIATVDYDFDPNHWEDISPEPIDLIKHILVADPRARYTTQQILQHPWMKGNKQNLSQRHLAKSLERLQEFNAKKDFKTAVHAVERAMQLHQLITELHEGRLLDPNHHPEGQQHLHLKSIVAQVQHQEKA